MKKQATRFPEKSYTYLLDVLGKKLDSPLVQEYLERFPYQKIQPHPSKSTVILEHPDGLKFSPEELLGMLLEKSRSYAETTAGEGTKIKEVVITVPPYFSQAERRSVVRAANLAGLKLLQLINSNTAVALNYGVFRIASFNESKASNVMFYDMGATSTIATLVSYQVVKTKDKGYTERTPTLTVKGVGFDRRLGGLEMQLRLRAHLAAKFSELQKIPLEKVTSNKRAMSKLMKESGRLKKILSANTEHVAQVENVMDDKDLKVLVTRDEFESMSSDLLGDRLLKPVRVALESSGLTVDDLDQIILFGGNTRVPKVQEVLSNFLKGKELGKSVNSDEAAALGAVYQAAFLSKGFKVKTFGIKDSNLFPIQVDFSRNVPLEDGSIKTKSMTRMLFGRNNVYPQKKVLTFSKHDEDFEFYVNYAKDHLTPDERDLLGPENFNITKATVTGVREIFSKYKSGLSASDETTSIPAENRTEAKGIKAHFRLDESGILVLDQVEATFEKAVVTTPDESSGDASNVVSDTIAKLGNTFSRFFSSSSSSPESSGDTVETQNTNNDSSSPDAPNVDSADSNSDTESKADVPSEEKTSSENNGTSSTQEEKVPPVDDVTTLPKEPVTSSNEASAGTNDSIVTGTNGTSASNGTSSSSAEVKKEMKLKIIKEPLKVSTLNLDVLDDEESEIESSKKRLKDLRNADAAKLKRDSVRNSLESFIAETKMKLDEEEFQKSTTPDEKEQVLSQLNSASEWLEDHSDKADVTQLQSKMSELKTVTHDMFDRVKEHRERPEALKALNEMLNISNIFLENAKNLSEDQQIFTSVEISTLEVLVTDTSKWFKDSTAEQSKQPLSSAPVVTIKQIAEKISVLDREVKYLVNKLKITPPKKKVVVDTPVQPSDTNDTKDSGSSDEISAEDVKPQETEALPEISSDGDVDAQIKESSSSGDVVKDDADEHSTRPEPSKTKRKGEANDDDDKSHTEL